MTATFNLQIKLQMLSFVSYCNTLQSSLLTNAFHLRQEDKKQQTIEFICLGKLISKTM